jgi:predicted amidohydrolase YtcJ
MSSHADLIIMNAHIFTSDDSKPYAEAVAVKGNRIVYVGSNQGAKERRGENPRLVDAHGNTLTPGFIDSHFHLLWGALWLGSAQLDSVKRIEDLRQVLQRFAARNQTSEWVDGRGVKYGIVSTRQELDEMIPDRPVYINAYDGHTSWANTKALEMAGVLHPGKEIGPNGNIVRDENGLATGELREKDAMSIVSSLIPVPSEARRRELLTMAIRQINATGITSIHNMNGDMEELMTYAALEDTGEMSLRVYVPYWIKPETTEEMLVEAVEMSKVQAEYVRGGAVKFFMDGVWESYTALTLEPYADNPDARPEGIHSAEHFTRMAELCDKLGLQIFVHCCGDGAVRRTLDGYEAIQKRNGKRDSRHRVEHIEVIHPDDLPRFKELGVIASVQTSHVLNEDDIWPTRVGERRWPLSFAWRSIKNAGATLALGSDWNVAPFDPLFNIDAALNRTKWSPSDPDQRLTLEECILGYTRDAAYAEFQENQKGQIREGYLADLALFSHDLFQIRPEDIQAVRPIMTVMDGKVVYEADQ